MPRNVWITVGACVFLTGSLVAQQHPLDPVSRRELDQGISLLERQNVIGGQVVLAFMGLHPPSKTAVLAEQPVPRLIAATAYDRAANRTTELVLDVSADRIVERKEVRGVSPLHLASDNTVAATILRANPRWRELVQ